jgi:adenine deaminase
MHVDTIFKHVRFYNTLIREWETQDIAVLGGIILYIGNSHAAQLSADAYIDCSTYTMAPGFIDIHLHIESSLCTPLEFSKAVLPLGVTTVVSEPHEIANVFGADGVLAMVEASQGAPIDIFYGIPSSVPSTNPELETTGGKIGRRELTELVESCPDMICLGEVMNYGTLIKDFQQLVSREKQNRSLELIDEMKSKHPLAAIEGHCPSVRELELAKLLYLGIDSDHCLQDLEGMKQRFARGMFVELQEKSVTDELITYLEEHPAEGLYAFVTDDVPPDVLHSKGHLDHVIRKAMQKGLSLEKAIIASSIAPARRMGLRDRGVIAPGKLADLILLEGDGQNLQIHSVYKRGVPSRTRLKQAPDYTFAQKYYASIQINRSIDPVKLLSIPVENNKPQVSCRVMQKHSENTYTREVIRSVPVTEKMLDWQGAGLNLVSVASRYSTQDHAHGLLEGDQLSSGALCSSYAHDHHNLLTIGDNEEDMLIAFNRVVELQGGICVVSKKHIIAEVPLPVGGILSDLPLEELTGLVESVQGALRNLGIQHPNPIMSLCTLTLPVSPELKITDKGLVRTEDAALIDLIL